MTPGHALWLASAACSVTGLVLILVAAYLMWTDPLWGYEPKGK